jgi:hypothetical protein
MDWLIKSALVLFVIIAFFFVYALIMEVWNQVIMGRYKIAEDTGAHEFCEVANEILGLKTPAGPGGWLTREQLLQVRAEMDSRRETDNTDKHD